MAKKFFGTKLFATALATFALASCQSESTLLEPAANNLCDVELSITVSKGELTRTNLNLSEDEKKLLLTWNEGDIIQVSETDGKYAGFLTVTQLMDNGTKALFEGKVKTFTKDGKHSFAFISLGQGVNYEAPTQGAQMPNKVYDFSDQIDKGVAVLAANDLLMTTGEVDIKSGTATFEDLYMKRQFAFGRFTLLYNGQPLTFDANTVVTVSKSDMNAGAEVEFPTTVTPKGEGSFTVKAPKNDFYVTLVPGSEESPLEFTVKVGDIEYKGFSKPYKVEKNDFFRLASGLEKGEAIPIDVTRTDGADDEHDFVLVYDANYPGSTETKEYKMNCVGSAEYTVQAYDLFAREGYEITSWNTKADGTGTSYAAGNKLTITWPTLTETLYAKWEQSTYEWTVTWKDGYTENPIKEQTYTGKDGLSIEGEYPANPKRPGYTFKGWDKYIDKLYKKDAPSVVITAKWEKDPTVTTPGYGHGDFAK